MCVCVCARVRLRVRVRVEGGGLVRSNFSMNFTLLIFAYVDIITNIN